LKKSILQLLTTHVLTKLGFSEPLKILWIQEITSVIHAFTISIWSIKVSLVLVLCSNSVVLTIINTYASPMGNAKYVYHACIMHVSYLCVIMSPWCNKGLVCRLRGSLSFFQTRFLATFLPL